jgi:acetyltransferase-like isoleucine patch superfamily enzyme
MNWQRFDNLQLLPGFRGRLSWVVQIWWLVQATLFRWSTQVLYGWRRWLLRAFGARIGRGVIIRPSVQVTYPWKLMIGDYAWVGDVWCFIPWVTSRSEHILWCHSVRISARAVPKVADALNALLRDAPRRQVMGGAK